MSKTISYKDYLVLREQDTLPKRVISSPVGNPKSYSKKYYDRLPYDPDMYPTGTTSGGKATKEYFDTGVLKEIVPVSQPLKPTPELDKTYAFTKYNRCFESHKPLKIVKDESVYLIYGGSCSSPVVTDADIYVGFDKYLFETKQSYPWNGGASFCFPITDRSVPTSLEDTKKLLEYLAINIVAGKKIHIGCIGGHGRTGTIMAALVTYMTGNLNSIEYVRANYCQKAVESQVQVNWLNANFGITKAPATKPDMPLLDTATSTTHYKGFTANKKEGGSKGFHLLDTVRPVKVKGSVWGF